MKNIIKLILIASISILAYSCGYSEKDSTSVKVDSYGDILAGNWHQVKGKVKARWGKLTDNDLTEIEGNTEVLAGKIQARYGRTKVEALEEIEEWKRENNSN